MREIKVDFEASKAGALEKWIPVLSELAHIGFTIWRNEPSDVETQMFLLSKTVYAVNREGKGRQFLFQTSDGTQICICLPFLCHLLGYRRFYKHLNDFSHHLVTKAESCFAEMRGAFNTSKIIRSILASEVSTNSGNIFEKLKRKKTPKEDWDFFRSLILPTHPHDVLGYVRHTGHDKEDFSKQWQKYVFVPAQKHFASSFLNGGSVRLAHPSKVSTFSALLHLEGKPTGFRQVVHCGKVGICQVGNAEEELDFLEALAQHFLGKVGHTGKKGQVRAGEEGALATLRQLRSPLNSTGDSLMHWVSQIWSDEARAGGPHYATAKTFSLRMKNFCCSLVQPPLPEMRMVQQSSLVVTTTDCWSTTVETTGEGKKVKKVTKRRHHSQVPHLVFSRKQLLQLEQCGAKAFVGTMSLTAEGSHIRVIPNCTPSVGGGKMPEGNMVFIPQGCIFWQPATVILGDGFRTGPKGNPRLQLVVVLVPTGNVETVMDEIGQPQPEFLHQGVPVPANASNYFRTSDESTHFHSPSAASIVKTIGV